MLCASVAVIPGVPVGDAATIDEAKSRFRAAWTAFKDQRGPEKLAEAYATI